MQPVERFQTHSAKGSKPIIFKIWKWKFIGLILPDFLKKKWLNNTAYKEWILGFVVSMENIWIALTDACLLHRKIRTSSGLEVAMIKNVLIIFCWKIPIYQNRGHINNRDLLEAAGLPENFSGWFLAKPWLPRWRWCEACDSRLPLHHR